MNRSPIYITYNEITTDKLLSLINKVRIHPSPEDFVLIGECFLKGAGTEKDMVSARNYAKLAVEYNYAPAFKLLAACYRKENPVLSFRLIRHAYKLDPSMAAYYASYLINGIGTEKKEQLAFNILRLAADEGDTVSMLMLSKYETPVKWIKLAVEGGDRLAMIRLAKLYLQDGQLDKAEKYYLQASELGSPNAAFMLSHIYKYDPILSDSFKTLSVNRGYKHRE